MTSILNNLIEMHGIADMYPANTRAFKQFQVQDILYIPENKPDMEQIVNVYVKVKIIKSKFIESSQGISFEGQNLTGKKLVVEGCLQQKIEYVADEPVQSVHAAHFDTFFSSYIVLGEQFDCDKDYEVIGYIEDIYVKQVDERKLFKNVMLLLTAVSNI